jgi:hypothetical protein
MGKWKWWAKSSYVEHELDGEIQFWAMHSSRRVRFPGLDAEPPPCKTFSLDKSDVLADNKDEIQKTPRQ